MSRLFQRVGQAVLAVLILTSITSAGPIGYSVISNGNDHLLSIDLATGAATDLGALTFGDAEGISFDNSGTLYAIGGTVNEFWNITTPPGSQIGATGTRVGSDAGLGLDPTSGVMYNLNGAGGGSGLYTVNTSTGATTLVGTSTVFGDNIAISSAGVAYAIDGIFTDSLYQVNLATGAFTLVGGLGLGNISVQFGSSFDPATGTLWALDSIGQIFTVNTTTGAASFVANVTLNGARVDGFEGLGIPVPEPSSLILTLSGAAVGVLARYRRRSV